MPSVITGIYTFEAKNHNATVPPFFPPAAQFFVCIANIDSAHDETDIRGRQAKLIDPRRKSLPRPNEL